MVAVKRTGGLRSRVNVTVARPLASVFAGTVPYTATLDPNNPIY